MVELSANSGDSDQMPHSATYDLNLHCLPITFWGLQITIGSQLWIKPITS